MRKGIPNDQGRRDRIREAALDVIADLGLRGVTFRAVAQRAGVSPGSLTYYFADMDALVLSAFELLADEAEPAFNGPLRVARTRDEAIEVLVDCLVGDRRVSRRDLRAARELYSLGSHDPRAAALVRDRLEADARAALMLHFTEPTARALDALVEGWWTYQSWNDDPLDPTMVRTAVHGLVAAFDPQPGLAAAQAAAPTRHTTTRHTTTRHTTTEPTTDPESRQESP